MELQQEIKLFFQEEEDSQSSKDYFGNYKGKNLENYLSREDDTIIRTTWKIINNSFSFSVIVIAVVGAFVFNRYVKKFNRIVR